MASLVRQLRIMLQLTQTEAQMARVRLAQARTDEVRDELTLNADNAERRSRLIEEQLRQIGGVPDVVTPFIGRLNALFKSTIEQAEPFDEALLQDLALEQQLLGRARYLKSLGEAAGNQSVRELAEHLEAAHTETVEWINTVLAQEALGGPAALRATPFQRAAGGITKIVSLPLRVAREGVNRTVSGAQEAEQRVRESFGDTTDRMSRFGGAARDVMVSGRNASLDRAEREARREGATRTANALHETRRGLGTLDESELPIRQYPQLNQQDAVRQIKDLGDSTDVRTVMAYEQAHKDRSTVVEAARTRISSLAEQTLGS